MGEVVETPQTRLSRLVGGPRGVVEGGLPPIVFVITNAAVSAQAGTDRGLTTALLTALATAAVLFLGAVLQRRPPRQALAGLAGLAVAAGYSAWTGDARAFFLPGLLVDAAYAVALVGSVAAGRPLIGYVHAWVVGRPHRWRADPRLRRTFATATLGWAAVYSVRAGTQGALYSSDQPELLAIAKIGLGWPLTVLGVVATLAFLRHRRVTAP